jgi:flagellar hook assembly protein FlgD
MAEKQGLSTAKGFQEKVPFAESTASAKILSNMSELQKETRAYDSIEGKEYKIGEGYFEITETGVYIVVLKKYYYNGVNSEIVEYVNDVIVVSDLDIDTKGLNNRVWDETTDTYKMSFLTHYHHYSEQATGITNGVISINDQLYRSPGAQPCDYYAMHKAYKIADV